MSNVERYPETDKLSRTAEPVMHGTRETAAAHSELEALVDCRVPPTGDSAQWKRRLFGR